MKFEQPNGFWLKTKAATENQHYFWFMLATYSELEKLRYTMQRLKCLKNKFCVLWHKSILAWLMVLTKDVEETFGADVFFC